jgi:phosphoribosylglycinamide formyltransferase-1
VTIPQSRLAVLASGGGSNLQAIIDHLERLGAAAPATIALVVSDRENAGALDRARRRGIAAEHLPREREQELLTLLERARVTHVALAGYLRLIPADVVARYRGHMVNVHPALLPAFGGPGMYGRRVHEAVIASGVRVSGPTVHLVDERYDEGAIVAQWPVPVRDGDTADTLAERVLAVEHRIYPPCVAALCAGELRLEPDGHVSGAPHYLFARFIPADGAAPFPT